MDQVESKLDLLIDGMTQKETALREILGITENQSTVLGSALSPEEIHVFIVNMNREKQTHIQTVIGCDRFFEGILKEIGAELDAKQHLYKPQVAVLQKQIRSVMDLDVAIRVLEEKNNGQMKRIGARSALKPGVPGPAAAGRQPVITDDRRAIRAYERNSRNYKG